MAVIILNCVRSGFWMIFIFLVDILICVRVVQMQNKYFKQAVRVSKRDLVRFPAKAKRRCIPGLPDRHLHITVPVIVTAAQVALLWLQ